MSVPTTRPTGVPGSVVKQQQHNISHLEDTTDLDELGVHCDVNNALLKVHPENPYLRMHPTQEGQQQGEGGTKN